MRFPEGIDIHEDTDLFLQLRLSGRETFRTIKYSFSTPPTGSNSGGLQEWYSQKRNYIAKINLQKKWGSDIITLTEKNGIITERINYKLLNELSGN